MARLDTFFLSSKTVHLSLDLIFSFTSAGLETAYRVLVWSRRVTEGHEKWFKMSQCGVDWKQPGASR